MSNDTTMGLTSSEAARELRVSTETLLRWAVKENKVPYVRLGARKIIFSRKEIEQLLSANSRQPEDRVIEKHTKQSYS